MIARLIFATCGFVCLFLLTTARADWPVYLNGNDRAGFTSQTLDPSLRLAWTYNSPAKPIKAWSGPRETPIEGHVMKHRVDFDDALQVVIGDGRVYFGSTVDHRLHCVDAKSGRPIWDFYTEGPIRLAPTLAHGNVYFGSDDGLVYCLRATDGQVVWEMRVGPKDDRLLSRGEMISRWPVRTGVLIDGDVAYFGAGVFPHETVYLCAVNAVDGSVIWRNDTISDQNAGRNDLSPQGYLLANDNYLYVPSGRSLPVAVDKETGKIVFQRTHSWRTDAGGVVGGTKALLGDGQVYAGGPHHFLAMNQKTGDVGESWINGRQMVLAGELAYLMDGEKIFCVNRSEHARASQEKQKWFLKLRERPTTPEKLAHAKQMMKEAMKGGIIWEHASDFDGVLVASNNAVIAGGMNEVVMLDRESGEVLWRAEVDGNVRGLAIDSHVLTVSTDSGNVYAFRSDVSGEQTATWPGPAETPFPVDDQTEFYQAAAREILQRSGHQTGYCLVVGSGQGRLAYELAQQSGLTIYAVEPDAAKATASRQALERAGIHATRITVVNTSIDAMPFSNYFANLIVSESMLLSGRLPGDPEKIARHLKPCGGVVILGRPAAAADLPEMASAEETTAWLTQFYRQEEGEVVTGPDWQLLRRGKLPGAGNWSHQYGNVANTSYSDDHRIRDGLGVLWYGDPGPSAMINRHEAAGAPLSTNGRMFIQGTDRLMAYDAYNGNFLWEFENPGAIRTGVFNNRETHNLAASDDALYVAINNQCLALDAATGTVNATYQTPESPDGVQRAWAYLAYDNGQVFGTSTIREELEQRMRRRGLTVKSQTDAVFAVDTETGERMWTYRGSNILHTTIAIGPERIYFIDSSITPEERQQLYLKDKGDLKQLTGEAAEQAEAAMKDYDVRLAVALDRRTGEKLWEKAVNVTDTTNVSAGGGSLTLMVADGRVVLCGANANGHYWKQFLSGQFDRRKLLVLDAADGTELWSKNANYMNRPAVVGDVIYAEPWAFNLHSGQPKTRQHPLTGAESQWRFSRPGHHCGVITATPNMMFFRSGFIGYYDLYEDSGTRHFAGQRLGCWVNAIPGNGLVMIPEASAGCVCQFSIASTVVMEPKSENKSWGIFSAVGPTTPVKRIGINFGAPGDRKEIAGHEWFGYPRPSSRGRLEFVFDLKPQLASGGGWYSRNLESVDLDGSDKPWVYASGARGLKQFEIPLLGKNDPAARYDVKLLFANLDETDSGPFAIKLQSEAVKSGIVIQATPGEPAETKSIEFSDIVVDDSLLVELVPEDPSRLPILSGIEVTRKEER
ncbi:outer membrane protein assembly factor BamB family protein [Stieleria mannarensis]|uniref:outer membrane protein assembly factor BamB family protein n=1 Tax=Stieleria mannarensis TaxID=2755585 RepID=UPI001603CA98|nr:PQQ-binding-like beta-propeller repeat protein [Rhodopirellula sp. JC639]